METETERAVSKIVEPIVASQGMELVAVEYKREARGWVLRIYLDKKGGVSLDDCVLVSNEVGTVLDVEDLFESPYTLEVSSPGLNRILKKERDFKRSVAQFAFFMLGIFLIWSLGVIFPE